MSIMSGSEIAVCNPRVLTGEQNGPLCYYPKQTREQQDGRPGIFPPEAANFDTNVNPPCCQEKP